MRVLGLIPARGGSKGIPRKNIRKLNGKPLLIYTAEAALASKLLDRVVLSTEDEEVAAVGRSCGIEVPFLRPFELAQDTSPTLPVVQHAIEYFSEMGDVYDAVCILQPVTPLRSSQVIDACISMMSDSGADTVITISKVPVQYNPHFVYFKNEAGALDYAMGGRTKPVRRQDVADSYVREGSVYLTTVDTIKNLNSLFGEKVLGLEISPEDSVNIDSQDDWDRAEIILRARDENPGS